MKPSLKRIEKKLINAENLTGDTSHIWGNAKNLTGRISSGLTGRISSGLTGCVSSDLTGCISSGLTGCISSGLYGCADNISGNLDDCDLTEEDRENGVDIQSLVQ